APIVTRPNFMQKEKTISTAEKGTIMHTVMLHNTIVKALEEREIIKFVDCLITRNILTKQQVEAVDVKGIAEFFATDIAQKMMQAPYVYRELPFSLSLNASDVYAAWQSDIEEKVLVQGVIDCVIPKNDGWNLLDYKTDTIAGDVNEATRANLRKRYEVQ